jgi:hypothetical protein
MDDILKLCASLAFLGVSAYLFSLAASILRHPRASQRPSSGSISLREASHPSTHSKPVILDPDDEKADIMEKMTDMLDAQER